MNITLHTEEENTTDQQVPAAALHRTANHHLVITLGIMQVIIPIQEPMKDLQLDISPDTEVKGSVLKHLVVIKVHQDQVAALLLILNPQPQVQSTVQTTNTSLIHVTMTEFIIQSTAHHLIDVIIINMINVIINMKNICHLRGVTIIKIGKFSK